MSLSESFSSPGGSIVGYLGYLYVPAHMRAPESERAHVPGSNRLRLRNILADSSIGDDEKVRLIADIVSKVCAVPSLVPGMLEPIYRAIVEHNGAPTADHCAAVLRTTERIIAENPL